MGMTEDEFFVRFVSIFQEVGGTVLDQIDMLPFVFDTAVAPDSLVRAIGSWVGLDWVDPSLPDIAQRRLVRGYSALLPWRGTRKGLTELLHLITGVGTARSHFAVGIGARHRRRPTPDHS